MLRWDSKKNISVHVHTQINEMCPRKQNTL